MASFQTTEFYCTNLTFRHSETNAQTNPLYLPHSDDHDRECYLYRMVDWQF